MEGDDFLQRAKVVRVPDEPSDFLSRAKVVRSGTATAPPSRMVRPTDMGPEDLAEAERLYADASTPAKGPMELRGGEPYDQAAWERKHKATERIRQLTGTDKPGSNELARALYNERGKALREKSDNPMESPGILKRGLGAAYNTTKAAAGTVLHGLSAPFVSERTNMLRADEFEKMKKDVGAAVFGAPESGVSMSDLMTPPKIRLDPKHYSRQERDLPAGLVLAQGAGDVVAEALPVVASLTTLDPLNATFEGIVAAAKAGQRIYKTAQVVSAFKTPEARKAFDLAFDTYEQARIAGKADEMKAAAERLEGLKAAALERRAARGLPVGGTKTSPDTIYGTQPGPLNPKERTSKRFPDAANPHGVLYEAGEPLPKELLARQNNQPLPSYDKLEATAQAEGVAQKFNPDSVMVANPPLPDIGDAIKVGDKEGVVGAHKPVYKTLTNGKKYQTGTKIRVDFEDEAGNKTFEWLPEKPYGDISRPEDVAISRMVKESAGVTPTERRAAFAGNPVPPSTGGILRNAPKVDSDKVAAEAIGAIEPPTGAAAKGAPGVGPSPAPNPEAGFANTGLLARSAAGAYGANLAQGQVDKDNTAGRIAAGAAGALLGAGAVGAVDRALNTSGGILKRGAAALGVVEEGKALGDAVLRTLPDAAKAGWKKVVPPGQLDTIAKVAKTDAELAHPAVAQAIDDSLAEASRSFVKSYQHQKDMDLAFDAAGILPGTPQRQAVQLYMDGTHAAPSWLTGDARRAADEARKYHQDLLDRAVAARVTSQETRDAYRGGFSTRKFATSPPKKPSGFAGSKHGVEETFYKQDAEGLVVNKATAKEVEDAIQKVAPGWKNFRAPTQEGGTVLVKVGRGPQAEQITNALEQTFGSRVVERIHEMPMAERLARGELMDPIERFHATSRSLESRVVAGELLADIERGTAWKGTGAPPSDYLMIPDDGAYGMLRGKFVPAKVHAFVTEKVGTLDEAYKAMDGVMSAMREAYIATPRGVGQNFLTNFLQYSTLTDVHPVFNVDGLYQWGRAAKDMATFRKTGKLSPMLQAFVDAGGDLRNITEEIADELDRVAVGLAAADKDTSAFNRAKKLTELIGGSPHFQTGLGRGVDTAVNAATGAVRGGLKGLLRGEGVIRGAAEGAAHMTGATQVAKGSKSLFGFMDPWYQVTAFGKQYELALAKGMNHADAARYAMGEVAKYSQEFRSAKLAKSFNLFTGRAPIVGKSGGAAQQLTKAAVPTFMTFPYNQARIFAKAFQEKPLSATLALMQGKWARRAAIGELVRRGVWSKDESEKFDRQHPDDLPALVPDGKGGKRVVLWNQTRQWPGAEVFMPGLPGSPGGIPMGILPGAAIRTGQAVAGTISGDTSGKEMTSGFPVFQPDEAQQPGAGVLRQLEQGFGGPLSPQGSYRQQVDRSMAGKKDLGGQVPDIWNVALGLLTGVRVKDYDPKSEDRRAKGVFNIERGRAEEQLRKELRTPMNTPEEKKKAKGIFKWTIKDLKDERNEKK